MAGGQQTEAVGGGSEPFTCTWVLRVQAMAATVTLPLCVSSLVVLAVDASSLRFGICIIK